MTNPKIIERLKKDDWFIICNNKNEVEIVLTACEEAGRGKCCEGLREFFGKLPEFQCIISSNSMYINGRLLFDSVPANKDFSHCEEITESFFKEIKKDRLFIITAIMKDGNRYLHFCSPKLLQGINHNLWIPIPHNESLFFEQVARIMMINKVCHNVISIKKIRQNNETSFDYEVIYNLP